MKSLKLRRTFSIIPQFNKKYWWHKWSCNFDICESESHSVVSGSLWPHGLLPTKLLCSWTSPGQNTGVGSLSLLQWISPTQKLNRGPLHCRWILYRLSYQGSPLDICEYFTNLIEVLGFYFISKKDLCINNSGSNFPFHFWKMM